MWVTCPDLSGENSNCFNPQFLSSSGTGLIGDYKIHKKFRNISPIIPFYSKLIDLILKIIPASEYTSKESHQSVSRTCRGAKTGGGQVSTPNKKVPEDVHPWAQELFTS